MQSYYNIIDYVPYAACYISVNYFLYSWSFILLNPLHLLYPTPSGNHKFILCIYENVFYCWYFKYLFMYLAVPGLSCST